MLWYLVEYIRMKEGYTYKEFYDSEEGEKSETGVCKRYKSENMTDLSGGECDKTLTEEDYKKLHVDIKKDVITGFKVCNDCDLVHSLGAVRRY